MITHAKYSFKPGLWPSLVTLLVFPCLLALGFWQLDRAGQKRDMYQAFLDNQAAEPLDISWLEARDDGTPYFWRHTVVSGAFDPGVLVFLDNQVLNGTTGYFVYALFKPESMRESILINFGWIAAGNDRQSLPAVQLPVGKVSITGVIKGVPPTGIVLGEAVPEKIQENYRVQAIDIDQLSSLLNSEMMPFIVRLGADSAYGLTRQWSLPGSGEAKHLGYAFQWFALAATLIIIYLVVNLRKEKE